MADAEHNLTRPWVVMAGAVLGAMTLLFFMGLVLLAVFGRSVPCDSRYLVITVIAFGAALSTGFLGGSAAAKGGLPLAFAQDHPFVISAGGGVAVLIIMLTLGNLLFAQQCKTPQPVACSDRYQSFFAEQLRFGFCYPRDGWELDQGAIQSNAADIYVRNSLNKDLSLHFHVSLIPSNYADQHERYSQEVANTWRQLDPQLSMVKTSLAGRDAYQFSLRVKDRQGVTRPTDITHVYLTSDRLLEIIAARFVDTSDAQADALARMRSSVVIERF